MKFSSILKGLAVFVALFTIAQEASAQLPVRTQQLRLLGTTSGTLTQQANATTTSFTVTWPAANATWPAPAGTTQYFLRSSAGTATNSDLSWFGVNGDLVDNNAGSGLAGQVTFWADDNSITGEAGFLWATAGNTLTIGQSGETAEIVFTNGTNTGTLQTATLTANVVYQLPAVPAGTVNVPVASNLPSTTVDDQILLSNTDGTATWTANPFAGVERGVEDPADGSFTHTVTLAGTIDATPGNDVIIVTSYDISGTPSGNILSVTARSSVAPNTFTVSSTGPFSANERISYIYIPIP